MKSRLTYLIVILSITFFINTVAHAQGAAGAAGASGGTAISGSSASAVMGSTTMSKTCGTPWGATMCAAGAGLIVEAVLQLTQSDNYNSTGAALTDGSTDTSSSTGSGPSNTPSPLLPPAVQDAVNTGNAIAAQQGTTLQALADQAAAMSAEGSGPSGGLNMDGVPPEVQAAIKKAAKDAASKYHVSAVATEDSSNGGGGRPGKVNSGGLDLNALLNGLKDRGPASVAGLQKTFNGEPIGVAGDNIFQQITRKYKTKIAGRAFLDPPTTLQKNSFHN